MPDDNHSYFRRRNIVIAAIAAVAIVAAIVRVMYAPTPSTADTVATAPTTPQQNAPARPATADTDTGSVNVSVGYAGAAATLPQSAKVFVFVRPVGERIPLGAHSYAANELPLALAFSKPADGVDRDMEVVARLSMSGAVGLQPGDVEAVSQPFRFGTAPAISLSLAPAGPSAPSAAVPPPVAAEPQSAVPSAGPRVPVRIELGAGVVLPPTTVVYLIARGSDGGAMPLAVKRLNVGQLPADVVLSDADAMTFGRSLSGAHRIELIARATRSGDVKATTGDYEARSGMLDVTGIGQPVVLVLDRPL
jgi:hypothetical protein